MDSFILPCADNGGGFDAWHCRTCFISGQKTGLVDSSTYFKLESQDKRPQIRRWRTYDIVYLLRGGLPADLQEKS